MEQLEQAKTAMNNIIVLFQPFLNIYHEVDTKLTKEGKHSANENLIILQSFINNVQVENPTQT